MKSLVICGCLLLSSFALADAAVPTNGEWVLSMASDYFAYAAVEKTANVEPSVYEKACYAQGYFSGAAAVLVSASAISPPQPASLNQIVAVIQNYVREHPKEWQKRASELIEDALIDAWPGPNAAEFKALRLP